MHKTGSSSIQHSLAGYDDGSRFYAKFDESNHSRAISTAFSHDPELHRNWAQRGYSQERISEFRKQFRNSLIRDLSRQDRDVLIISAEVIGTLDDSDKKLFIEFLKQHVREIDVYCYVRDPLSFAASAFQQAVKSGLTDLPVKITPRYRQRTGFFKEVLGSNNVHVFEYNRDKFPNRSVVDDFFETTGLNRNSRSENEVNESLTTPAIKLLYLFNRTSPCQFGDPKIYRARQRFIKALKHAYREHEKLDLSWFANFASFSEVDYLRTEFGIAFEVPRRNFVPKRVATADWLKDTSDIDLTPLQTMLQNADIETGSNDPVMMVNRLFYHHIAMISVEQTRQTFRQRNRNSGRQKERLVKQINHLRTACQNGKAARRRLQHQIDLHNRGNTTKIYNLVRRIRNMIPVDIQPGTNGSANNKNAR